VRLDDDEREGRRHCFDDPGVGPSHAPSAGDGGEFEDIRHHLKVVLVITLICTIHAYLALGHLRSLLFQSTVEQLFKKPLL
jgi:hypothetical protein